MNIRKVMACLLALGLWSVSGAVNAQSGDPELVAGSYNCSDNTPPNPFQDSQALSAQGTPFRGDFSFSCRGPVPTNCTSDAAQVANALTTSECVNSTSVNVNTSSTHPRTTTSVNFVCEGIRKKVLAAIADACMSMF